MRDYGTIFLAVTLAGLAVVALGLMLVTAHSQGRLSQRPMLEHFRLSEIHDSNVTSAKPLYVVSKAVPMG